MRRRELLLLVGGVMTTGGALRAQQKAMPAIGALNVGSPPANLGNLLRGLIHQGMSEKGFVEGQNMMWEYRWADFHGDRLPALAADLVSRKVDLIITGTGFYPAVAAKNATSTIPITSPTSPTRSGSASSPVSPGRAATSPASATSTSS